jgi:hypothetical protein
MRVSLNRYECGLELSSGAAAQCGCVVNSDTHSTALSSCPLPCVLLRLVFAPTANNPLATTKAEQST